MNSFPLQGRSMRVGAAVLICLSIIVGLYEFNSFRYSEYKATDYAKAPSHLDTYFTSPDAQRKDYHEWNAQTLRDLHACIAAHNCGSNQRKVALLAAHWFQEAIVTGWRGGEGVWAISVYDNLRALGYTTFFAVNWSETLSLYRNMPDLVKVVIRNKAGECHADAECVKGPSNPTGIPAWKIFDFEFFPSHGTHHHASLMGGRWILSADTDVYHRSGDRPIQYIGYSVKKYCSKEPVIPLPQRDERAYLLMKELYFVYGSDFAWNRSYFALASRDTGVSFTGGWDINQHYNWNPEEQGEMVDIEDQEHGVVNLGRLNQSRFTEELRKSKIMVGMGSPWWSPSPYDALCQGVPFLNPILNWNDDHPEDRKLWYSQHPSLSLYNPPYVYNVRAGDYEGFVQAIRQAASTEIQRFIPPHMTDAAVRERLVKLMETDWRTQAAALLEDRVNEGRDAYMFEL